MSRFTRFFVGLTLLLSPFLTLALTDGAGSPTGTYCPRLSVSLQFGSRDATTGGQVSELQHFLSDYYDIDPSTLITGYFGRITQGYVVRFQQDQGLSAIGIVGPLTRARIASVCGTQPNNPLPAASCQWNGQTIPNGQIVVAYQSSSVPAGSQCIAETRRCANGVLSGTYQYPSCTSEQTISCTPEPAQIQILACPAGQTGSIIQTRTSSCPGPTWSPWTTTSNTCTSGTSTTTTQNASCTFNGQTITHGSSATAYLSSSVPAGSICTSQTRTCSNGVLSGTYTNTSCTVQAPSPVTSAVTCETDGANLPANYLLSNEIRSSSRTGSAPLTVRFWQTFQSGFPFDRIDFGDGSEPLTNASFPSGLGFQCQPLTRDGYNSLIFYTLTHTYTRPGTYTVAYKYGDQNMVSATVTVTGSPQSSTSAMSCVSTVEIPNANGIAELEAAMIAPTSGRAPLAVNFWVRNLWHHQYDTIHFGDGTSISTGTIFADRAARCAGVPAQGGGLIDKFTHTYSTPGTYTMYTTYQGVRLSSSQTITVTGASASAEPTSNLASALTALEAALNGLLAKLK